LEKIMIDPSLLKLANWKIARKQNKQAFVPPGGGMDPAAMGMGGGMPPMDPSMMGGMPPMDPSMMGGMPPMDPAMAGGGAPPTPPEAAPSGDPAAAGTKKPKLDPNAIYVEQVRNRKLLLGMYRQLGLKLPEDILDDEDLIAPGVVPETPKKAPAPEAEGPAGLPPIGDSPGINPIEPAQMAGPSVSELLGTPGTMPG
jgi:hypothetical protein